MTPQTRRSRPTEPGDPSKAADTTSTDRQDIAPVNYADAIDCPYVCSFDRRSCPWECIQVIGS